MNTNERPEDRIKRLMRESLPLDQPTEKRHAVQERPPGRSLRDLSSDELRSLYAIERKRRSAANRSVFLSIPNLVFLIALGCSLYQAVDGLTNLPSALGMTEPPSLPYLWGSLAAVFVSMGWAYFHREKAMGRVRSIEARMKKIVDEANTRVD